MPGRLIYLMGPSGAGKNSLIASAREKLNKNKQLYFLPRYVTRQVSEQASGDDDFSISAAAFAHYKHIGAFALDWEAHGYCYGVSVTLDTLLRAGKCVVVNGSRAYLETARKKYPQMTAVLITVPADVARTRLEMRARENMDAINARVERAPEIAKHGLPPAQYITIDNSGPLEHASQALLRVLLAGEPASYHSGGPA